MAVVQYQPRSIVPAPAQPNVGPMRPKSVPTEAAAIAGGLARCGPVEPAPTRQRARSAVHHYFDDRALVVADVLIARNERSAAKRLLQRVAAAPSCPVAAHWAELGLAELERLQDSQGAADRFAALAKFADNVGANWLRAQAAIALGLCGDDRALVVWRSLPAEVRADEATPPPGLGSPRVLWMMTT